ncbi:uncharacterized protein LOC142169738 [Nicotiana tabacum]|uniref:Uncharacterized protein LOC142169738 n=1 Tax=Nicotiana tabacum TaxID=4097 RepID=A0AC58SS10_TOBAC
MQSYTPSDGLSRKYVSLAKLKDFFDCYNTLLLNEIPWKGEYYTWTNKQRGTDRVCSRIDRAIANDEWMLQYGHLTAIYGEPLISDHIPILIPMREARRKLLLNSSMIQEELGNTYSDALTDQEKNYLTQLEKWSLIEESALQQKLRATWIKLGDSNTKYFSAVIKEKQQKKQITEIKSLLGVNLQDPEAIKEEFVSFYKSLMGTIASKLPATNRLVMINGPCLSHTQKLELCAPITKEEIYEGLSSIGNDKAPELMASMLSFSSRHDPLLRMKFVKLCKISSPQEPCIKL